MAEAAARPAASLPRRLLKPPVVLTNGFGLAILTASVVAATLLLGLGGWEYYTAPLDLRAYTPAHRLLKPSGLIGNSLGIAGLSLMLLMHLYSLRKRFPRATRWMGRPTFWLELHIFCGVLGPVLVTFHTSFKFNGVVSVAYWSMVIVMLSGVVGRYLYVRIPRSIRGQELTRAEIEEQVGELDRRLRSAGISPTVEEEIASFRRRHLPASEDDTTWIGMTLGELPFRVGLARQLSRLRRAVADADLGARTARLHREHAVMTRRVLFLRKTRRLFELWHVYHKPLAVVMGLVVIVHVATVWYFGYAFSMGR